MHWCDCVCLEGGQPVYESPLHHHHPLQRCLWLLLSCVSYHQGKTGKLLIYVLSVFQMVPLLYQIFFPLLSRFCMNRESVSAPPSLFCPPAASYTWWGPSCWCPETTSHTLCHNTTPTGEIITKTLEQLLSLRLFKTWHILYVHFSWSSEWTVERPTLTMWSSLKRWGTVQWRFLKSPVGWTTHQQDLMTGQRPKTLEKVSIFIFPPSKHPQCQVWRPLLDYTIQS